MTKYRIGKVAPTPKGVYDETVRYAKLDFATDESGNSLYMSKVDDNIGHALTDTDYWMQCLDASEQMAIIDNAVENIEESVSDVQTLAERYGIKPVAHLLHDKCDFVDRLIEHQQLAVAVVD
jgi:hypothetical protein